MKPADQLLILFRKIKSGFLHILHHPFVEAKVLQLKKWWSPVNSWCIRHRIQYPKPRFWMVVITAVLGVWFYFCLPEPLFHHYYSTVMEDRNGNFLSAQIARDHQWRFPQSDSVPVRFSESIRCFEDEYFPYHPGVNPVSMCRAISQNIRRSRVVSGGSTLSMQVIRLSRGNQSRSFLNKLIEMILAVRLECRYSKKEIMNIYASHAPFGGNVVGLEAASWRYFGRSAAKLSWGETAALAVLPNSPALVFPGKNHTIFLRKRNRLLDKLFRLKIIDKTTCELAKAEPLPDKPKALPNLAPHLLAKCIADGHEGQRIKSTIDTKLQSRATQIATKYARYYSANYINNIAVLVLDTHSGEIKAYVGNATIANKNTNQFVDNIISKRSSGSILKPFLYAAMINEGELLPSSLVSDIPTRIGSYAPENFEKTFDGAVPADQALAHSLNIPAVRELQQFGVYRFYSLLHKLGFSSIDQPSDYYGLSLILGGAEVSLYETTSIYAGLSRSLLSYQRTRGKYHSDDYHLATYLPYASGKQVETSEHSLFSAGALWFTMEALATVNRPWGETGWDYFASTHKVAWKTGTSFGQRDAWSVGTTPQYTIGVWVGNSTGEGRPGLTGVSYASPVMFELFKALNITSWYEMPRSDMNYIDVCKESGYRAGEFCPVEKCWVPKQGVKVKACSYHQAIFMDSTESYRVNGNCYPVSNMHKVPWFILPPSQEYFYRQNHPDYRTLPPYLSGCNSPHEHVFDLLEPDNNSAIYIPKGLDGKDGMLIFEAVHRNPGATLFWHLDNEFIRSTQRIHKLEIAPSIGKHLLVVEDENGNIIHRNFRILSK